MAKIFDALMWSEQRTCEFCYYEYFDEKAYPCSMCLNGAHREDKFQPKGRRSKAEQTERSK